MQGSQTVLNAGYEVLSGPGDRHLFPRSAFQGADIVRTPAFWWWASATPHHGSTIPKLGLPGVAPA